ncbi:ABC transporter ATP-binding protein [Bosea sp. 685]|uniref:ABC transporter ATP-binding protein n=1 Tax=Bosea sp. 685 TaxID=3080057 RepID=UPI0028932A37|nr:ABC transporter ATP-binding protein [Bosea sp. 685]WNJ88862.1 ABC transporter ATP-binding protein [Bosea sp. 685]
MIAGDRTLASKADAYLSLQHLHKQYAGFTAVHDLNLDVPRGELVALLGPSGCGKTTTLRMIAGLVPATAGRVMVGGRDISDEPPYNRDMGVVFQSYALFPHMTVERNIAFGLQMRRVAKAEIARRVAEAIDMVRLRGMEQRRPRELSGGQQQRVALARALVIQPKTLLFDEPLSNLDAKLRDQMRAEIREIQQRLGITAVFVTHDQAEALAMCDKVAVMNAGKVEQIGAPTDLYERPANPFVASFVGRINRLPCLARGDHAIVGSHVIRLPVTQSGEIEVMVRPHRIAFGEPAGGDGFNRVSGQVRRVVYIGDVVQYDVDVDGATWLIEHHTIAAGAPHLPGAAVDLSWRVEDTLAFARSA